MSSIQTSNVWLTPSGNTRIGIEGTDLRVVGSNNTIFVPSDLHITRNVTVTGSMVARSGTELFDLTLYGNANNVNLMEIGVSPYAAVHSIINLTPSQSLVISGIDTSGFEQGKKITIRNKTKFIDANSRLVLFEHKSAKSSANNGMDFQSFIYPHFLMPEDNVQLTLYIGTAETKWNVTGGNRKLGGSKGGRFDVYWNPNHLPSYWENGGSVVDRAIHTQGTVDGGEGIPHKAYELDAGTVSTAYCGVGNCWLANQIGIRSLMTFMRVKTTSLPSVTENFNIYAGFVNSAWTGTPWVPVSYAAWKMDIDHDATYWINETRQNSISSFNVSRVPLTADFWYALGVFVSGDGSQVDFFYSTDNGRTWGFSSSIAVNVPKGSADVQKVGPSVNIIRKAGTGVRSQHVATFGAIGIDL